MSVRSPAFPARTALQLILAGVVVAALLVTGLPAGAAPAGHSWSMNEAAGTGTMFDAGSPATDGNWLHIQAGVPGSAGTAYRFDGTSRVTVPDDASLDPGTDRFTVTIHVNFTRMPTDADGGDYDLIRKGLGATSGGYWKLEIYPDDGATKATGLCQMKGSAGHVKITGAPISLNDGAWHTLSCTRTSSDVTLTVDGTNYRKSVTIGSIANSDPLTIGADKTQDDVYTGDMDEVSYEIGSGSPPPSITGFSPSSGRVQRSVMITGSNFTGATDVHFNDVAATTFNVLSPTEIEATVPSGATTGPIKVTTPAGSATSTSDFTVIVTHARSVTLRLRRHVVARGVVSPSDASTACVMNVPVEIQRRVHGHWKSIGTTTTTPTGAYEKRIPDKPGTYRAKAPKITLNTGADVCSAAWSARTQT